MDVDGFMCHSCRRHRSNRVKASLTPSGYPCCTFCVERILRTKRIDGTDRVRPARQRYIAEKYLLGSVKFPE